MTKIGLREITIDGCIAYVSLSRGMTSVIDLADIDKVAAWNWYATKSKIGGLTYAARNQMNNGKLAIVLMHRIIAETPDGMETDHIDGDGLNNRNKNLRHASKSQNMHNSKKPHNNTSGFKGVHWHNGKRKWQANIKVNNKRQYLGQFDDIGLAVMAYSMASKKLHLDFSRLL